MSAPTLFNHPMKDASESQRQESWAGLYNNQDRPTMRYEILGKTISSGQWKWSEQRAYRAIENYKVYERDFSHITLTEYWKKTGKKLEFIRRRGTGMPQYWVPPREKVFFLGRKQDRMVVVGLIDMAVNRLDIEEAIGACRRASGHQSRCLRL